MAKAKGKIITKKHLAREERERIQNRYILTVSAVVIGIVVLLVGYGLINQFIIQPAQAVAQVDDVKITTREFQTFARYNRLQLVSQYMLIMNYIQMFGGDESATSYFQQSLMQIQNQLNSPEILGQTVLDYLIENALIRQEAERLGITVSEEEIERNIQESFSYYPNGTPTPEPTQPAIPTSTLSPTQLALVPPTAEATEEVIEPTAAPTEEPAVSAEPTIAPTPYTESMFNDSFRNYIDPARLSEKDFHWVVEMELYRQKVLEAVTADVERMQDQVWARHILVADLETAQSVLTRLEAGEEFAALASELSTDTGSAALGGDLGWFGAGMMVPEFELAAFQLEIGEISEPIQSTYGYHIIQVLGHEQRPMSDSDYQSAQQSAFTNWLTERRVASNVVTYENWLDRVPTLPALPAMP